MPWLRFHAYGVGLPKTGTTSLSAMLTNYRSGHEAWLDFLAEPAVARVRGEIDDETFWETVRNRFVPLRAEMDCVTCHHLYVDVLQENYPKAKFVVTYRDVRGWANSLLDLVMMTRRTPLDQRVDRSWYRSYGDWISEGTLSLNPANDEDDTDVLPALMRSWASYMRAMRMSVFARIISIRSTLAAKNGQVSYIARSCAPHPAAASAASASPTPSQDGRMRRVCVHAKIHGIARRPCTVRPALRRAGRLPMFM